MGFRSAGTKDSPQDDGLPLGVAADDEDDRYYLTFPPAQREQLLLFQRTRQVTSTHDNALCLYGQLFT